MLIYKLTNNALRLQDWDPTFLMCFFQLFLAVNFHEGHVRKWTGLTKFEVLLLCAAFTSTHSLTRFATPRWHPPSSSFRTSSGMLCCTARTKKCLDKR